MPLIFSVKVKINTLKHIYKINWPYRLTARTLGSHPRNRSSILRRVTIGNTLPKNTKPALDRALVLVRATFHGLTKNSRRLDTTQR